MSLANLFCAAIFPPRYKLTGRSSRAGFSQRVHNPHSPMRIEHARINCTRGQTIRNVASSNLEHTDLTALAKTMTLGSTGGTIKLGV